MTNGTEIIPELQRYCKVKTAYLKSPIAQFPLVVTTEDDDKIGPRIWEIKEKCLKTMGSGKIEKLDWVRFCLYIVCAFADAWN